MANPITVNPTTAVRRLSVGASDWLWIVMVIMGISALVTLAWAKSVRPYLLIALLVFANSVESNRTEHGRSIIWLWPSSQCLP